MLAAALEAEVDAYVSGLVDEIDDAGRRLVVHNGHADERLIATGAGPIRDPGSTGERPSGRPGERGATAVAELDHPALGRKSPKVAEVLP